MIHKVGGMGNCAALHSGGEDDGDIGRNEELSPGGL